MNGKNIYEEVPENKNFVFIVVLAIFIVLLVIIFFILKTYRKNYGGMLEFKNKLYINEKLF